MFLFELDLRGARISAGVAAALATLATLSFGFDAWAQWIEAARDLVSVQSEIIALHDLLGSLLFAMPAFALVWVMRNSEAAFVLGALIGAALLVSPYAMNYETALLASAFASRARPSLWIFAVLLVLACFMTPLSVLIVALIALVLTQA